jgi:hypothetical protein
MSVAKLSEPVYLVIFGGNDHPVPKKLLSVSISYPIVTVGQPTAALAPQIQASPVLMAALPPIMTVTLPIGKELTVG